MTTATQTKARLQSYIDAIGSGDVDSVMAHYAEDATCEDPVGGPVHRGLVAIRAFYAGAMNGSPIHIEPLTPIVSTSNNFAAMGARAVTHRGIIHFVETQRYNEDGKIVEMRAYYDLGDVEPV